MGNHLLAKEITASKEENNQIEENMKMNMGDVRKGNQAPMKGVSTIQAYDSMNAIVGIKVLCELIGIGIVLVFVSSIASMISIEHFSPLTILKERS